MGCELAQFFIEFKFEFSLFYQFEFSILILASSSLSPVKMYQVYSSLEKKLSSGACTNENKLFLKISSSSNSSSQPRIFASSCLTKRSSSSSSSQPRVGDAKIINFSYTFTLSTRPIYVGFRPTIFNFSFCITHQKFNCDAKTIEARTVGLKPT